MTVTDEALYPCPFCRAKTPGAFCPKCGRNRTAARRVCRSCGEMTPMEERDCCHCGAKQRSDLYRKIPQIVALFAVAIGLSIIIRLALD